MANDPGERPITLSTEQAYESAYRFVAQYYNRERIVPFMLMLSDMAWEPSHDHHVTSDPAHWFDWMRCVQQTLDGAPLPEVPPPDR
jgi:hypothetical protein